MNWEDQCYLLSKRKFRENANIINVFTFNKGKVGGIVYGGSSRKIRNYLQISNKLFIFYTSKNDNKIGYFKTELIQAIAPKYFNDKERTSALISLSSLLNLLLPEAQPYKAIYKSYEKLISSLDLDNWIILYILFEINLIKELGY
jgi:DNA repair protein RecO (recombination protein O)